MPPTRFPSKKIMRAFWQWRGLPEPPQAHVDELEEWIQRARRQRLDNGGEKAYNELSEKSPLAGTISRKSR